MGGGIRGYSTGGESLTSAVVENNIITNNTAYGYDFFTGGGVSLGTGSTVRNNSFINNSSYYGSGAVHVGANSLVEGNFFLENVGHQPNTFTGAGALEVRDPSVIVRKNVFQQNSSGGIGGAFSGTATVYDNLFLGNATSQGYSTSYGGAAFLTGGSFINNTLVGNIADSHGPSGVYALAGTTVSNNIIVGGIGGVGISSDGSIAADFNNIWNNDLGAYDGFAVPGAHDIHLNPQFVGPDDYQLSAGSPSIDAGSNAAVPLGAVIDLDGNPRIIGIVDMGAYESPYSPLADFNGNGVVDAMDFVFWRKINGGNAAGYNTWRANFGRTFGSSGTLAIGAVPEPASLTLSAFLLIGGMLSLPRRAGR